MAKHTNTIGEKFGMLTVIEPTDKRSNKMILYICRCECGNEREVTADALKRGHVTRCKACADKQRAQINLDYGRNKISQALTVEGTNLAIISKSRANSNNTSGHKGVIWDKSKGKWRAQIVFKKQAYNLGRFDSMDEAIEARINAEERLFEPLIEKYKNKGLIIDGKDFSKYIK